MEDLKAKILLSIEMSDSEMLTRLNTVSIELSLSLERLIVCSISKLLYDIEFVRNLRQQK